MYTFFRKKFEKISETKRSLINNVYWSMLGKLVNIGNALFIGILVARYLGPEQYGLMNYVISLVSLFTVLSNFGLDNIEIRELSKHSECNNVILGTTFRLRLILAVSTILLIGLVILFFETDRFTQLLIMIYSLSIIFSSFNVIRNYFTSILQNEYIVKTEIVRTAITAVIKIILLLSKVSLIWFIIASTFDIFFVAMGYLYSYKHKIGNISTWKYDKFIAKDLLKQSFPLLLSGTAVIIYQRIDQIMIGNMIDITSVGYFSTAGRFTELILFLPTIMTQTITPLLVRVRERNLEEYACKKQQFVNIIVWISIALSIIVSLCSYWLITLTFGYQYLEAVPVLQIMAFKAVGMALSSSAGQLIIIEKIHKWAFIRNLIACAVCVCFNFLFIPIYGIIGAAIVSIITIAFSGCLGNLFIPSYHPILKIQLRALFVGWKDLAYIKSFVK